MHTKTHAAWRAAGAAALVSALAACGGDGGGDQPEPPAGGGLSSNQQAFENSTLAPNASYQIHWNLSDTDPLGYAVGDSVSLSASPRNGAQSATRSAPVNLAKTLAQPELAPTRVLKNGTVLVVPGAQPKTATYYDGGDVRVDTYANDGTTVAYSDVQTSFTTVPLTGKIGGVPGEMSAYYSQFWNNATVLDWSLLFNAGSRYITYSAAARDDRYIVEDCGAVTTGADVSPCLTGSTLQDALAGGLANGNAGTVRTVGGVLMWISTGTLLPDAELGFTARHMILFERNGNVYGGTLITSGTTLYDSYYLVDGTKTNFWEMYAPAPFQLRLNKPAYDSIAAAMKV